MDYITTVNQAISNNRVFSGGAMLIMNYGSRFVLNDLTEYHQEILAHPVAKKIILFSMCFIATKDVILAIICTFTITLCINFLLNHESRFSIIPYKIKMEIHKKYKSKL